MPCAINEVTLGKEAISSKSAHTQCQYDDDDDDDDDDEEEEGERNKMTMKKNNFIAAKVPTHNINMMRRRRRRRPKITMKKNILQWYPYTPSVSMSQKQTQ